MRSNFTFEEARDLFINIEKEYDVFKLEKDGVFFWKLIRFELFDKIIRELDIINEGHPLNIVDKVRRLIRLIEYCIKNIGRKKYIQESDVLFLTHGRKQLYNGVYVDIYLHDIIEHFTNIGKDIFIIDRPDHYGIHHEINYGKMIYFERLAHISREAMHIFTSKNNKASHKDTIVEEINVKINNSFNLNINLAALINKRISRFKVEKKYFDGILDKVKPKKIFLVVSYGKEELISSAEERDIKVTEVQHGVISKYHMGYYFPFDCSIPYFPSELVLFGEYWKKSTDFPINNKQVIQHFSQINRNKKNDSNTNKVEAVLFISQASKEKKFQKLLQVLLTIMR